MACRWMVLTHHHLTMASKLNHKLKEMLRTHMTRTHYTLYHLRLRQQRTATPIEFNAFNVVERLLLRMGHGYTCWSSIIIKMDEQKKKENRIMARSHSLFPPVLDCSGEFFSSLFSLLHRSSRVHSPLHNSLVSNSMRCDAMLFQFWIETCVFARNRNTRLRRKNFCFDRKGSGFMRKVHQKGIRSFNSILCRLRWCGDDAYGFYFSAQIEMHSNTHSQMNEWNIPKTCELN